MKVKHNILPAELATEMETYHHSLSFPKSGVISYYELGNNESLGLIMIHGLGGNGSHFWSTAMELADDFHIIIIELPGYGKSTKPSPSPSSLMEFYAKTIQYLVEQKCMKEFLLVGHSMGGQIAVITQLKSFVKARGLVLIAPAGFETFTGEEGETILSNNQAQVLARLNDTQVRRLFEICFETDSPWMDFLYEERINQFDDSASKMNFYQWRYDGIAAMLNELISEGLKEIEIPSLIMLGGNDTLIPNPYLHSNLDMLEIIKAYGNSNFKTEIVENAGHMVQLEQSERVAQLIKDFIDTNNFNN